MTRITNIATYLLDSRFIAGIIEKNITLTLNDKCVNNRVQIALPVDDWQLHRACNDSSLDREFIIFVAKNGQNW